VTLLLLSKMISCCWENHSAPAPKEIGTEGTDILRWKVRQSDRTINKFSTVIELVSLDRLMKIDWSRNFPFSRHQLND
jgi:hypothetical protein